MGVEDLPVDKTQTSSQSFARHFQLTVKMPYKFVDELEAEAGMVTVDAVLTASVTQRLQELGIPLPLIKVKQTFASDPKPDAGTIQSFVALRLPEIELEFPFASITIPARSGTEQAGHDSLLEELSECVAQAIADQSRAIYHYGLAFHATASQLDRGGDPFALFWQQGLLNPAAMLEQCRHVVEESAGWLLALWSKLGCADGAFMKAPLFTGVWQAYINTAEIHNCVVRLIKGNDVLPLPQIPDDFFQGLIEELPQRQLMTCLDRKHVPPSLRPSLIYKLSHEIGDDTFLAALARSEDVAEFVPMLMRLGNETILKGLYANPRCPRNVLEAAALDGWADGRAIVAENPSLPTSALSTLVHDRDKAVRMKVTSNPKISSDQLLTLLFDFSPQVQCVAARHLSRVATSLDLAEWAAHLFGYCDKELAWFLRDYVSNHLKADFDWLPSVARILRIVYEQDRSRLAETIAAMCLDPPRYCYFANWSESECRTYAEVLRGMTLDQIVKEINELQLHGGLGLGAGFTSMRMVRAAVREIRLGSWSSVKGLRQKLRAAQRSQQTEVLPARYLLKQEQRLPALRHLRDTPAYIELKFVVPTTAKEILNFEGFDNPTIDGSYALDVIEGRRTVVALTSDEHANRYLIEITPTGDILHVFSHPWTWRRPMLEKQRAFVQAILKKRLSVAPAGSPEGSH